MNSFEATDDDIKAFPTGLRMVIGDPSLRTPPTNGYNNQLDPADGPIQPVQWTCPRSSYDPPSWPTDSDGLHGVGMGSGGAGSGFPDQNCDGYASPLRADIHFPSCYNPEAGLTDYKNNMQFPSSNGTASGRANCPEGWIHTPHIFYEVYWDALLFKDLWTTGQGSQPFVLANGDPTGYSLHGDFIAGWDEPTLQQIIDNCDAGDSGMDKCPGVIGGISDSATSCNVPIPEPAGVSSVEKITGIMEKLPGNNPIVGWGGTVSSSPASSTAPVGVAPSVSSTVTSEAAATSSAASNSGGVFIGVTVENDAVTSAVATTAGPASPSETGIEALTTTIETGGETTTITRTVTRSAPAASGTSAADTVNGFNSIGCYSDNLDNRVLSGQEFVAIGNHQVTTAACISYCETAGFSMAGTEYGGQVRSHLTGRYHVSRTTC